MVLIVRRRAESPPVTLQPVGHDVRRRAFRIAEATAAVVKTSKLGDLDPKTAKDVLVLERNALRVQGAPIPTPAVAPTDAQKSSVN